LRGELILLLKSAPFHAAVDKFVEAFQADSGFDVARIRLIQMLLRDLNLYDSVINKLDEKDRRLLTKEIESMRQNRRAFPPR
jgi:hypothetical protein